MTELIHSKKQGSLIEDPVFSRSNVVNPIAVYVTFQTVGDLKKMKRLIAKKSIVTS